jgi:hypothetical protein
MSERGNFDLIGYLVGALDVDERLAVEVALRDDPALRIALREARRQLEIVRDGDSEIWESEFGPWDGSPPPGLADRTLQFIARQTAAASCEQAEQVELAGSDRSLDCDDGSASHVEPASKRGWRGPQREPLLPRMHGWRFADLATVVAVCFASASLIIPMISASRSNAEIRTCANNQRQIGMALTDYSEHQNGYFPRVAESGSLAAGGIYAPTLLSTRYVTDPRVFVCPGSPLATDKTLRIPLLSDLKRATGTELAQLRQRMGGSYGYALGYRQDGVYRPTRNLYRESFALVADTPSKDFTSSPNHFGSGHNVLLEDGHVVFLTSCRLDGSTDDIFTNDEGKAAAGCHINDAVVVRSDVSP